MNKKSESVIRAQKRKKQHAVDMFGGQCVVCGYNKCLDALEFHHVDKSKKEEKPSYIIMRWSWKRAKVELDKCILICSNCHRELHSKEKEGVSLDYRVYIKPWITKVCKNCNNEFDTKRDEQIFCDMKCKGVFSRKTNRPKKEELINLIEEYTWTKIGLMYGVSDNAVRKWAKNYGII